jgi:hypothetical protein
MDNNAMIEIKDVVGLSKPVEKLIDIVSNTLGGVLEPIQRKRLSKARAEEINIISEALRNNADLPIEYKSDYLQISTLDSSGLRERAALRLLFQELKKQQNIDKVIDKAYDILENDNEGSDEPVNPDWFTRLMNSVEDISDEQMQEVWGKILAGEVREPNTFSFRTLDVVKNLTKDEAFLFDRVSSFAIQFNESLLLPHMDQLLKLYGVNYMDIVRLNQCGLVSTDGLFTTIAVNKTGRGFVFSDLVGIVKSLDGKETEVTFYSCPLTECGGQLLKIVNHNIEEHYFYNYMLNRKREWNKDNLAISVHRIIDDSTIEAIDLLKKFEKDLTTILTQREINALASANILPLEILRTKTKDQLLLIKGITQRTYKKLVAKGYHFPGIEKQ